MKRQSMREKGKVKYFNGDRGFGFLQRDGSPSLFFHVRHFIGEVPDTIEPGMKLSFEISSDRTGRPMADQIETCK